MFPASSKTLSAISFGALSQSFSLRGNVNRLGIFPEIPLPGGMPGWVQALLRSQNGSYAIEVLTRLNQTKLNGVILKPKQQYPLHDGDLLQFGHAELRFEQCMCEEQRIHGR